MGAAKSKKYYVVVAQQVEQQTKNLCVIGSTPIYDTNMTYIFLYLKKQKIYDIIYVQKEKINFL